MDERAQAIAAFLAGGSKPFHSILVYVHGEAYPHGSAPFRDVRRSLQRLRAEDAAHHCGRLWHPGPGPLKKGDVKLAVDSSTSVTLSAKWLDSYEPEPNSGCWLWTGPCLKGYGVIKANGAYQTTATRAFYALHFGPIPDGLLVCHKCDTPACVNPEHLFVAPHQANMDDMVQKGRSANAHSKAKRTALQHRGDSRGGEG